MDKQWNPKIESKHEIIKIDLKKIAAIHFFKILAKQEYKISVVNDPWGLDIPINKPN